MQVKRKPDSRSPNILGSAVLAILAFALFIAGVSAEMAASFGPSMGDIVRFLPNSASLMTLQAAVPAMTQPSAGSASRSCVLASSAMSAQGGSLVVEEWDSTTGEYLVHWAGGRTSYGLNNCGTSAELLVRQKDLMTLLAAASGPQSPQSGITPANGA